MVVVSRKRPTGGCGDVGGSAALGGVGSGEGTGNRLSASETGASVSERGAPISGTGGIVSETEESGSEGGKTS